MTPHTPLKEPRRAARSDSRAGNSDFACFTCWQASLPHCLSAFGHCSSRACWADPIAADGDTYELSTAEFKHLRCGRPLGSGSKTQVWLRLDADVLEKFRTSGNGWQTRINDALKSWA